jgi:hypothetical protein
MLLVEVNTPSQVRVELLVSPIRDKGILVIHKNIS